jgi:hypothetical protein
VVEHAACRKRAQVSSVNIDATKPSIAWVSDVFSRSTREECVHRKKQTSERDYDENNLMDMLLAGRQSAYQVNAPEDRIVPEHKPSPFFAASVWNHSYHNAEYPHPH